jgi:protein required for attachment to host cells
MNQYCVVVANGSKARFFTLEDPEKPELESGPNLVKHKDLISDEQKMLNEGLWSETKSGGNRGHGGQSHGYDDHRSQHEDDIERRFANSIADECKRISHNKRTNVVLVSQKRMLGHLRNAIDSRVHGIHTEELAKDLIKLSPMDLHKHLAREKLIPERRTPAV